MFNTINAFHDKKKSITFRFLLDATANVKSPPKEVKTNKNLQMRHKFQDPVPSLYRTEALSPTWTLGRENNTYLST